MKKLVILSAIALSGLFYNTANAQIRVHFGINLLPHIYVRPAVAVDVQAPAAYSDDNAPADYDPADDYYYLPDVNAYYSVADQCYYYNDGDNWVPAAYLPGEYNDFDWRSARHFEVRAPRPYLHNDLYMNRFHGANFNWARYNAPRDGYTDQQRYAGYRNQQFDNRGYNQQFANRDRSGFDNRGQNFDNTNRNNFQNRDDNRGRQFQQMPNTQNQSRDRGNFGQSSNQNRDDNRGQQQNRFAQNSRAGYGGHQISNRRMF